MTVTAVNDVLRRSPIIPVPYESKILQFHKELLREGLEIPLILPVRNIQIDSVAELLNNLLTKGYIHVDVSTVFCESLLYWLCKNYDDEELIQLIWLLVIKGADVNFYRDGQNPLMLLIKRSRFWTRVGDPAIILETVVRLFVLHGLDVNQTDSSGNNILSMLIKEKVFTVSQLAELTVVLVANGFNINGGGNSAYLELLSAKLPGISEKDSATLLILTGFLLINNLDVNAVDDRGYNALMLLALDYECHRQTLALAYLLIGYGIDVNYKNYEERNALNIICFDKDYPAESLLKFTVLLVERGIEIDNVDSFGQCNLLSLIDREDSTCNEVWEGIVHLMENSRGNFATVAVKNDYTEDLKIPKSLIDDDTKTYTTRNRMTVKRKRKC